MDHDVKHILIVEDDQAYAKLMSDRLLSEGYDVTVCNDGESGLRNALSNHPDVILLDINLPKISGLAVINNLRQDSWGENVPVIILTNMNPTDVMISAVLEHKPSYYLLKAETTLVDMVQKVKDILHNTSI